MYVHINVKVQKLKSSDFATQSEVLSKFNTQTKRDKRKSNLCNVYWKKLKSGSNQRKLVLQCRGENPFLGRLKLCFSAFWLKQVELD